LIQELMNDDDIIERDDERDDEGYL